MKFESYISTTDIFVGNHIFILLLDNYNKLNLKEGVITKVGKKYFYVESNHITYTFDKKTFEMKEENGYCRYCKLYATKEAYERDDECNAAYKEIQKYFTSYKNKPSYETTMAIHKLLKEEGLL